MPVSAILKQIKILIASGTSSFSLGGGQPSKRGQIPSSLSRARQILPRSKVPSAHQEFLLNLSIGAFCSFLLAANQFPSPVV